MKQNPRWVMLPLIPIRKEGAVNAADFVVEAATENREIKLNLFKQLLIFALITLSWYPTPSSIIHHADSSGY